MLSRTPALCLRAVRFCCPRQVFPLLRLYGSPASQIYDRSSIATTRHISTTKAVSARGGGGAASVANAVRFVEEQTLESTRKDLASTLRDEIEGKTAPGLLEEHSDELVADLPGFGVVEGEEDVRIVWQVAPYSVEVVFEKPTGDVNADGEGLGIEVSRELDEEQLAGLEAAEDARGQVEQRRGGRGGSEAQAAAEDGEDDDEGDDDEEEQEDEESSSDSSDDEDDENNQVMFEVKVARAGSTRPIGLWCMAGLDNRLYVEQVFVESGAPLNFASLSEEVQDRVYDFLDSIKVDDRFGFYMRRRFYKIKREQAKDTLSALLELVEPGEEAEPKKNEKKKDGKKPKKPANK